MKVLVIGGVAAGTKTAAKLKRENRDLDVTLITKGENISYAGCGLPYYVGGVIENKSDLIVNTPKSFSDLTQVEVKTGVEALSIDRDKKIVNAINLNNNEEVKFNYDKLVIATGADPVKPPIEGIDLEGVYYMRTPNDAIAVREVVETDNIKRAVVVGGGFIGLEVAENLHEMGVKTTLVEAMDHIMPGFDDEVCSYVEDELMENGIMVLTGERLISIEGDNKVKKVRTDKRAMKADMIVMAVGIRANTKIASDCGLALETNKTIKVNEYMQTNDEDIYAVGDCVTVKNILSGKPTWSPMGSSANKEGRCVAKTISGEKTPFNGVLGTGIVKLLNLNAARTGLTEKDAKDSGYEVESVIVPIDDKAHYYPDSKMIIIKLIADKNSKRVLGAQIFGEGNVDKQIDIVATAITFNATISDLQNLDLAYAPPFSTAIHPLGHVANVLLNKIDGAVKIVRYNDFIENQEDYKLADVNKTSQLEGIPFIDLATLNGKLDGFDYDDKILLVCARGKRAYLAYNRMKHFGYKDVQILEGGLALNREINTEMGVN
ncbi:FAD-dependent oxidoreductase [Paraclostridium sordellii]|uniref:FAD-dependent oxidoreductase n=1 Tax=Paraclostridium sordellii TaxID=1505 RepID=UPI0005E8C339|nr:FAD-dependent oxidoreductase [Paeniclostridium sordellii]CEN86555.1 FAD-dependent pyridine nucleotide-disulfide oxidoreductase [[Clostridium] sordellii] [Paeniclostridium sordellii]CEP39506.1 FAD-dependent pyridine nucleotide-disulfide oxidoreductase [[Clostridium] sordellii] [Paeniclostridium sordellii]CEP88456.1 FAD-dependent pyridine nucleotide-disulfide oxidoreductase [[Clostridium] sordellii] [Paeniclostridium sordellii]CEQ09918.1 FAD-dependent pyridine nucleotide-disulfide oxidoreducta